jgi:hypothetical protein
MQLSHAKLEMQFNIKLCFCPKQNIFSFEKYAEVHMHMNGMMNEELGCYKTNPLKMNLALEIWC